MRLKLADVEGRLGRLPGLSLPLLYSRLRSSPICSGSTIFGSEREVEGREGKLGLVMILLAVFSLKAISMSSLPSTLKMNSRKKHIFAFPS